MIRMEVMSDQDPVTLISEYLILFQFVSLTRVNFLILSKACSRSFVKFQSCSE